MEGANNQGTPVRQDPMSNGWNLGAELRFEVGLISGHSYRLQVIVHDGNQTRGGDSGEACAVFCAGTGSSCGESPTCGPGLPACPAGTMCQAGCCIGSNGGGILPPR
jgi:hypothetical protein